MVLRDLPSLVDHQQNPLGIVDHPEVLGRWGLPVVPECLLERCRQLFGALHELVDHHHVHVRRLCAEMQAQVARAFNDVDLAPINRAVAESCSSRSIRSLTITILKSARSLDARSMRATKTMVSDLPDPWVCQTTPDRSCGVFPARNLSTIRRAARCCW